MAKSISMCAVATVAIFVALVFLQPGRVDGTCDQQTMIQKLAVCIPDVNKDGAPDHDGTCCASLRDLHDTMHPDDACICSIMSQPAVAQAGMTKQKAIEYIGGCIYPQAVPACLAKP